MKRVFLAVCVGAVKQLNSGNFFNKNIRLDALFLKRHFRVLYCMFVWYMRIEVAK